MSRAGSFYNLGMMPALMGLSHLAPVIGAIHTATGSYQFPGSLLVLIASISALVDSIDTYKDVPRCNRPRKWVWNTWVYGLWAVVFVCTAMCGLQTAIIIYRVLPLGLLWGAPCIPRFSKAKGVSLIKPKTVLGHAKSIVVAVCMASVCAETGMEYYCHEAGSHCSDKALRARSFHLVILYQFFRETSCDVRDIEEDAKEGLNTLPVRLGKQNTLFLMTLVGFVLDSLLTRGIAISMFGVRLHFMRLAYSMLRVVFTMSAYAQILQHPRENCWAWGIMSLFGLVPVLFAQAALRG